MEAVPDLERYLRDAPIMHAAELRRGGGGHPNKQLVILDGGLGAVAKLASTPPDEAPRMVRAEVAAWRLAYTLGFSDLVPTTVLRTVPSIASGEEVEASLQVVWPRFRTAAEEQRNAADVPDHSAWRIGIFDDLIANADRNETNWGFVEAVDDPKLIDHGHAFEVHSGGVSPFAQPRRDQEIPDEHLQGVRTLVDCGDEHRLREVLDDDLVDRIIERGRSFVESGRLAA